MLGLCLLIMFTLGVKREDVYDMQFAQLFKFLIIFRFDKSKFNSQDEEYSKLRDLMVELG